MWPFSPWRDRAARTAKERLAFITGGPAGGDAFWSWGSVASSPISPEAAEGLAAVLSAVNAISGTIAGLPAYVVKADDSRAEVSTHPLMRLIRDGVNDAESWSDFVEGFLASCLLRGNGLAEIKTDARGAVAGLRTMPWPHVTPLVTDAGDLAFDVRPMVPPRAGQQRRLLRSDVLFMKDRGNDGYIGVPRLQRAAGSMQTALDLQRTTAQFMANATRPSGLLTSEQKISPDNAARFKQEWQDSYSGEGKGKIAVLHSGLEFKPLSLLTSEDLQIIAHREFSVQDIALIFAVPLFMLGDATRATYASARESSRQFAMQALAPWVTKLQRAFQQTVLGNDVRLVIDLGDLLRADPEMRWASWQRARQAGILSPNDIRLEEGWPASSDPTADSIAPPNTSAQAAASDTPPADVAPSDKIISLGDHRDR